MWNEIFLFLSSPHLFILGIELCLPGWRFSMTMVASFLMVGGQLLMPGVAALCRNWPDRDDWQVLQIVIISPFVLMLPYVWWVPPSEEFHSRRGPILLVLSQAMACTVHTALHRTEHSSPTNKQCSLSPVLSCSSPLLFLLFAFTTLSVFVLLCVLSPHPSRPSLCRIFPESLRWLLATQHYRRSKAMMLRIARKNQVDMTTEPSGVLTGEKDFRKDVKQRWMIQNTSCYKCILSFAVFISLCKLC